MRALPFVLLSSLAFVRAAEDVKLLQFEATTVKGPFVEQFLDLNADRWTPSEATKKTPVGSETFSYVGEWKVEENTAFNAVQGDLGLVAKSPAAHHAISTAFDTPIDFKNQPLVVQYEVKFQKGGNCGGGYLKLLEEGYEKAGQEFSDKTPWVIMFGPDLTCPGAKVHFIFRYPNPLTGEFEEKHVKSPPNPSINKLTMLYTLIVKPDHTFSVLIDNDVVLKGNLLEDFNPPVNPAKEIDDPDDEKPSDWVEEARISDPDATKPEDWDEDAPYEILDEDATKPDGWLDDEPDSIPDPEAQKPEEWDDEEDGDWIPPTIRNPKCTEGPGCGIWKRPFKPNPAYKGKWFAPMIENPAYKGVWKPRLIPNPGYYEDLQPLKKLSKIGGVGIEIWTMTPDILFDNIYIGHSEADAKALAAETFERKKLIELQLLRESTPLGNKDDDDLEAGGFVDKIRAKVQRFIELAKVDPLVAFKQQPETGAALAGAALTLLGMLGALFGLVGSGTGSAGVTKSTKKTDAVTPDDKKPEADTKTPVAPAGGDKKEDGGVKKRK